MRTRVILAVFLFIALAVAASGTEANAQQAFEPYYNEDFGIALESPAYWTVEGDDPWLHSDITPWHLPLIPIKEFQPAAVDILLEGKKTVLVDFAYEEEIDALTIIRVAVEKMPFGMSTLDAYAQHTLQRIATNNDNVQVNEHSATTISGNPAVRLVLTFGEPGAEAKTTQILTVYGNLAYIFQYDTSSADSHSAKLANAQHVFDSVRISPPTSRAQALLISMIGIGVALAAIVAVKVRKKNSFTSAFLRQTARLFPSAFGIEVLCVASAEIGGILGLWYWGFNAFGITMAYVLAYALAGFTTFASILGRSAHSSDENAILCGCASMVADHDHPNSKTGFGAGIKQTFVNFAVGLTMMTRLHRKNNAKRAIRTSLIVLLSAESGCIIAAATVDIMLYQYSIFLSIPSALAAGTLTVASIAAYRSVKGQRSIEHANRKY